MVVNLITIEQILQDLPVVHGKHAPIEKHAPALKRTSYEVKDDLYKKGFKSNTLAGPRYIYYSYDGGYD